MQNCLGGHFVSSISLIRLVITGGTPRMNLHLKITWKSHLLHTVAIHLLMDVSHQDFVTSVPHCLPSLPVHFQMWYYTLVCMPLNGLVPWYPKNTPLSSCVTRRQDQQKNVTFFPDNDIRMWAGWLVDRSYGKTCLFFKVYWWEKKEWAVLTEKEAMNPCWVGVKVILNFG